MQAKRTNIGIAMITNPRVLFLDEPTSGLDSYTAHEVCQTVFTHLAIASLIVICNPRWSMLSAIKRGTYLASCSMPSLHRFRTCCSLPDERSRSARRHGNPCS